MTVVHNTPHRFHMQVVTPSNPQILKKFGKVRVEDWDDRVAGGVTWDQRQARGGYHETEVYVAQKAATNPTVPVAEALNVVRCHTLDTGELVLLHDDWL
jgi:hypothetical protein